MQLLENAMSLGNKPKKPKHAKGDRYGDLEVTAEPERRKMTGRCNRSEWVYRVLCHGCGTIHEMSQVMLVRYCKRSYVECANCRKKRLKQNPAKKKSNKGPEVTGVDLARMRM